MTVAPTFHRQGIMGLVVAMAVAVLLAVAPAIADAAARYVDGETGSDGGGNTCAIPATPCATITHAVTQSVFPDTIIVDDGTYMENVVLSDGQSLVYSNYQFDDSGPAIIDGGAGTAIAISGPGGGVVRGFTIRGNSDRLTSTTYVQVQDNVFDDPDAPAGVDVTLTGGAAQSPVNGNQFEDPDPGPTRGRIGIYAIAQGVRIHDNTFEGLNLGIQTGGSPELPARVERNTITGTHNQPVLGRAILAGFGSIIRENTILEPFDEASIGIEATTAVQLERNVIVGMQRGVSVGFDYTGVTMNGDLVVDSTLNGVWVFDNDPVPTQTSLAMTNVTLIDNVLDISSTNADLTIDSGLIGSISANAGTSCSITFSRGNEITEDPTGCHDFSTTADPGFVDREGGDYHLLATSLLIDMGNPDAPAEEAVDRDGDPRAVDGLPDCGVPVPRRDIGYDEFVPTTEIDCVAPNTKLAKKPKKKVTKKKVAFKLKATEPGSTFQCKINKKAWKTCKATVKFNVKVGKHTFRARAIDAAGNTDASPVTYKFKRVKPKKKR